LIGVFTREALIAFLVFNVLAATFFTTFAFTAALVGALITLTDLAIFFVLAANLVGLETVTFDLEALIVLDEALV
jgi:hypothetical protein